MTSPYPLSSKTNTSLHVSTHDPWPWQRLLSISTFTFPHSFVSAQTIGLSVASTRAQRGAKVADIVAKPVVTGMNRYSSTLEGSIV